MHGGGVADRGTVRGPYWDKSQGYWIVRWREGGEHRCFSTKDRQEASSRKSELVGHAEQRGVALKAIKSFRGRAGDFKTAISDAVVAANRAARAGDDQALTTLRRYIACLRDMAQAIVPHAGHAELEEEMGELVQYAEDVNAGKAVEDAAKPRALARPASTLKGSAGSSAALRRPRDPVPS